MTRTPLSRSKVKGPGHQAALLTAVLARQAAATVGRIGHGKLLLRCHLVWYGIVEYIVSPRAQLVYVGIMHSKFSRTHFPVPAPAVHAWWSRVRRRRAVEWTGLGVGGGHVDESEMTDISSSRLDGRDSSAVI